MIKRINKMTPKLAKELVQKKFPDYVVEDYCVPYKNAFVVMAHPDNGPEDQEHGFYPDPFYAVDRLTGFISPFLPIAEKDNGVAFFDAVCDTYKKKGVNS